MSNQAIDTSNPRSARIAINDELRASTHRSTLGQALAARAQAGGPLPLSVDGRSVSLSHTDLQNLANAGGTTARVNYLIAHNGVNREQALHILNGIGAAGPRGAVHVANSARVATPTPPATPRPATIPPVVNQTPAIAAPVVTARPVQAPTAHIGNSVGLDATRRQVGSPLTVVYNGERFVVQPNQEILSSPRFRALPPTVQRHVLREMHTFFERESRSSTPIERTVGYGNRLEIVIAGTAERPTGTLVTPRPAPRPTVDAAIDPSDVPPTSGGMDGGTVSTHRDAG